MDKNNSKSRNLALIVPSLVSGGMERVMSLLVNGFSEYFGIHVFLILLSKREKFYKINSSVTIIEPPFYPSGLVNKLRLFIYIRSSVQEVEADAILSFGEMFNSYVLLATRGMKIPVFISDRSEPTRSWGRFHHLLRRMLYPKAGGVICQTSYAMEVMKGRFPTNNIKVIGNPIPMESVHYRGGERKNIIISAGRLIKSKQFEILIRVFSLINDPNWELHIYGEGPQHDILRNTIRKLGVENRVFLKGNSDVLFDRFREAKIFAFTSNSEGFPNVIGEALSFGLVPVIFEFHSGARDLVDDGINGFVVKMYDEKEFQEKLKILMTNEEIYKKFQSLGSKSIKKFKESIVVKEYFDFITQEI